MSLRNKLHKWHTAGLIDAATVERILQHEQGRGGLRFVHAMLAVGALAILLGVAAIVSTNWDQIPAAAKLTIHIVINIALAATVFHASRTGKNVLREIVLFLLAGLSLTLMALIGQIYQTQSPTWQALSLWMIVISPFLFMLARARFTIICWSLAFIVTLTCATEELDRLHLLGAVVNLVPLAMLFTGELVSLRNKWPVWPRVLTGVAYALFALEAMVSQLFWRFDTAQYAGFLPDMFYAQALQFSSYFWPTLALAVGVLLLRRRQALVAVSTSLDLLPIVSIVFAHLPWLFPHPEWPVIGASLFMAYWAFLGWTGVQNGMRWLLSLAVVAISLRLVIVYIEVFGTLLQTGVGLIVSGVLLIVLVLMARKALQHLGSRAGRAA